jgi:steroid 5-alpha reductase family enzyme
MVVVFLVGAGLALAVTMAIAWIVQRRTGLSGWIDTIWSFAVGIVGAGVALTPLASSDWPGGRQVAVAFLVLVWSLRLGLHILIRTLSGGEDPRYQALHDEWGADFPRRLFWFVQIQAVSAFLLVLSIFVAAHGVAPFPGLGDFVGVATIVVAVVGEAIADWRLARFRADPRNRGRVCDTGLWGVSRHPNYFFEWLGWLAYPVMAIGLPPADPYGLIALVGPAFMFWLLVYVSGVPPLEIHMKRSRGEAFGLYQQRVNTFFPGPPRKGRATSRSKKSLDA